MPTPFFEIVYALLERKIFLMLYLFSVLLLIKKSAIFKNSRHCEEVAKKIFFVTDVAISNLIYTLMRLPQSLCSFAMTVIFPKMS